MPRFTMSCTADHIRLSHSARIVPGRASGPKGPHGRCRQLHTVTHPQPLGLPAPAPPSAPPRTLLRPSTPAGRDTTPALRPNQVFTPQHKAEALRYLTNHQNADGGFGLHIEGESTMFGTGLKWVQGGQPRAPG